MQFYFLSVANGKVSGWLTFKSARTENNINDYWITMGVELWAKCVWCIPFMYA